MADNYDLPIPTVNGHAHHRRLAANDPRRIYRLLRTLVMQNLVVLAAAHRPRRPDRHRLRHLRDLRVDLLGDRRHVVNPLARVPADPDAPTLAWWPDKTA
jgi:hypothetical protein